MYVCMLGEMLTLKSGKTREESDVFLGRLP